MLVAGLLVPASTAGAAADTDGTGIWSADVRPATPADPDPRPVTVGVEFSAARDGWVSGVRFYRDRANQGPHVGALWTASGRKLATVDFPESRRAGWQTATFDAPVKIAAGTKYVAAYTAPAGRYTGDRNALSPSRPATNGVLTATRGVYTYRGGLPTETYRNSNYYVDVVFHESDPRGEAAAPAPAPEPAPAPSPTPAPAPKPTPTPTPAPTPAPAPTTPPSAGPTQFPNASNTGVPAGTTLTPYTGPCTITTPNTVIDAKTVNCGLEIRAANVTISRSVINGPVSTHENSTGYSFTLSDSEVRLGRGTVTGVGAANFTVLRTEVTGGNRSANCWKNCVVEDSYFHGQNIPLEGDVHASGVRMGANGVLRNNTIICDVPNTPGGGGCSASLTGYGDFAAVENMTVDGNLIGASTGGYCAYGGSSRGKPFSADANNVKFTDNVFQRGVTGKCGVWGPITDFDPSRPGNVWSRNVWEDGGTITAGF